MKNEGFKEDTEFLSVELKDVNDDHFDERNEDKENSNQNTNTTRTQHDSSSKSMTNDLDAKNNKNDDTLKTIHSFLRKYNQPTTNTYLHLLLQLTHSELINLKKNNKKYKTNQIKKIMKLVEVLSKEIIDLEKVKGKDEILSRRMWVYFGICAVGVLLAGVYTFIN